MKPRLLRLFEDISARYFNDLTEIATNYYMDGDAINNAISNKQDEAAIFVLVNEYTCLNSVKQLINVFRFLSNKHYLLKDSTTKQEDIEFYESIVLGMIKFDKRIRSMNELEPDLYLSNPNDSGFVCVLNDFEEELNNNFINNINDLRGDNFDAGHLYDVSRSLNKMMIRVRMLLVNSSYTGRKNNKYFTVSKNLLRWLESTMVEIKDSIKDDNIK